jgi:hypothetical protein
VGSSFPSTKTITFDNKKGGMDLLVHYSTGAPLLPGHPFEIASYVIHEGKPKHDKVGFVLRVCNNIHQIPILESSDLQEEWVEEEKIPIKKDVTPPPKPAEAPKTDPAAAGGVPQAPPAQDTEMKAEETKQPEPAKQEFEIRKKNKKATSALKVDSQSHALAPPIRESFFNLEKQWFTEDQNILDFKAVKNELESYTYQVKNDIDSYGPMEKFIEEGTRVAFLKRLQETIDWIYGEGQSAASAAYKQRLEEFRKIAYPIKQRFNFRSDFPVLKTQYTNFTQEINDKLS